MTTEEILVIITKELTDQASDDEHEILKNWLAESGKNSDIYHSYKVAFLNGKPEPKARNANEIYNSLANRLKIKDGNTATKDRKRRSSWVLLQAAAVSLVVLATAFIIYETRASWKIADEATIISQEIIIKSNPRGIKTQITLPDGSKVKLNAESHLEYHADFTNDRSVKLIGEAFFEVVRDSLKPFYVKTGDIRVRVLGTTFNVEAFPFEESVKVALVSGKVLIEKKKGLEIEPLEYLNPDQMLTYHHQLSRFNVTDFDPKEVLGWKDGELHFDQSEFDDVFKTLERWYGVEFIIGKNADLSGRFTGDYKGAPLDVVLEGIGFTSDFDFKLDDKKVYIK